MLFKKVELFYEFENRWLPNERVSIITLKNVEMEELRDSIFIKRSEVKLYGGALKDIHRKTWAKIQIDNNEPINVNIIKYEQNTGTVSMELDAVK